MERQDQRSRYSAAGIAAVLLLAACTDSSVADGARTPSVAPVSGPGPTSEQLAVFLTGPTADDAAVVAEAMIASGDERWIPWLLDLHRFAASNLVDHTIVQGLAAMTGVAVPGNRTADFQVYGQWSQSRMIEPGAGYRDWKLGLYGRLDDEYVTLMDQIPDDLVLSQLHWGGVPRGGIPELNDPQRVAAADADWMVDDELVLGAVIEGEAVAYPLRILGHRELANDVIGAVPVSLVYCTLCRTGLLFDRRVGDQVLEFETSGLLWTSNKVMVDRQTDTLWQHLSGEGIGGPLSGTVLSQYPVVTTTWSDWTLEHPDSEVLAIPEPIFFPDIPDRPPLNYDYSPDAAYQGYYSSDDAWFPIFDTPDDLALKAEVIGLDVDGERLAVPVEALVAAGPQTVTVGGREIRLEPTPAGARAFGPAGEQLIVSQSFWFAWYSRFPDTAIWTGS